MDAYDAILIPGGGVRADGALPLWTQRRLEHALEKRQEAYLITLSAGTTHKPPSLDTDGHPIFESVAAANYLIKKGVAPEKILLETSSYDTIDNVFFSRMIHVEPLNIKRLLVITSEFHMPRTRVIFEWIYHLEGLPQDCQISFDAVSDAGIDEVMLIARRQKEAKSLETLLKITGKISTIGEFHQWLFQEHGAYALSAQVMRESGAVLGTY
ncbi:MAG: YdcF family protein [Cyanobacteria bacterium P01_H01_bin.21]